MHKKILVISNAVNVKRYVEALSNKFSDVLEIDSHVTLAQYDFDLVVFFIPVKQFDDPLIDFNEVSILFKNVPVFVVDTRFNFNNKLIYSSLGADLYLYLPICVSDFVKYVSFYSVKKELSVKRIIRYEDVELDCDMRILKRSGVSHFLRNKEFELMKIFISNPGRVITKNSLIEQIWDMNADFYNSKTVESHISYLRSKLDMGFEIKRLHTIYCVGYKFE